MTEILKQAAESRRGFLKATGLAGLMTLAALTPETYDVDYKEVIDVKEKIVISNVATNGLHFWSNGINFIKNAYEMIDNSEKYNGEYYIAPTYNYLIKNGGKVLPYFYNLHFPKSLNAFPCFHGCLPNPNILPWYLQPKPLPQYIYPLS